MELASLLVKIGITGVTQVESGLSRVDRAVSQTAQSSATVRDNFQGWGPALAGVSGLLGQVALVTTTLSRFSGVPMAAQLQRIRIGYTNMLGSAERATALIKELQSVGSTTDFDTLGLVDLSKRLLATGSTAKGVVREIKAITDAVATFQGGNAEVNTVVTQLGQMRGQTSVRMDDLRPLINAGMDIDKIVGAAVGKTLKPGGGIKELQKPGMTGAKGFDLIITGMEKAFGGNAIKNAGTLLGLVQNIGEAFGTIMTPTGELLIPALTAAASGVKTVGEGLKNMNEMTGGAAGLSVLLGGAVTAGRLFGGALTTAVAATQALTAALSSYSGVAMGAAVAGGAKSALNPFAGAAAAGPAVAVGGLRAAIGRAGGLLPALAGLGKGALGFLGKSGLGGAIASVGLGFLGNKIGGTAGGTLSGIGAGVGIGGALGSFIPGIGTAIGAAIGGTIGGIKGFFDARNAPATGSTAVEENTKAIANTLRDIHAEIIGGGRRTQRVMGDMEVEAALGRAFATGIG